MVLKILFSRTSSWHQPQISPLTKDLGITWEIKETDKRVGKLGSCTFFDLTDILYLLKENTRFMGQYGLKKKVFRDYKIAS